MSNSEPKTYWSSLEDLSRNEAYKEYIGREFPKEASELNDGYSRKNFLQIMGASVALAGLAACRKPVQKLLPYNQQPEEIVAGIPLQYASVLPIKDSSMGVLVTTNEGRPTKIEGNPDHPNSRGATGIFEQAAILDLYDVDRSRNPLHNGDNSNWDDFVAFCSDHFADASRRVAFISEATGSPTINRLKAEAMNRFPNAQWATWEAYGPQNVLAGTEMVFGSKLRPRYHFDRADVIVSLGFDFMLQAPNEVQYKMDYADRRRVADTDDTMNRLYVIESNLSVTGSNSDHRLRLKTSEIPSFTAALAAELSRSVSGLEAFAQIDNEYSQHSWISVLAQELLNNRGNGIVAAGEDHDMGVHAMAAAINAALDNTGSSVDYLEVPYHDESYDVDSLQRVVADVRNGLVDTLVIVGGNPVFNAPADLELATIMDEVPTSIHLSSHVDETSKRATWHVNRAHFLEYWGDSTSYDGVVSVIQPVIRPLFGGKSEAEFLNAIVQGESADGYDLTRSTWEDVLTGNFNEQWNEVVHNGIHTAEGFPARTVAISAGLSDAIQEYLTLLPTVPTEDIELVIKSDNTIYDGRYANNGWLQELPDQITKITWDNVAAMSQETAQRIGVEARGFGDTEYDMVTLTVAGAEVTMPAWILPGHADNSITVTTGFGRQEIGKVADDVGHDTYVLRTSLNMMVHPAINVALANRIYPIACTQNHHRMEDRPLAREATLEEYRANPRFAPNEVYVPGRREDGKPVNLFNDAVFPDHEPQWGMALDLNSCTGCGVCTIACQAENNIPVIGKREVVRNREMHWIRIDRYFLGDEHDPQVVHQPVPCMQCEQAPCEMVCPVAATTHSDDGLNQMTYNQCIGTRYCSNNCPYKVRRFNFFNYAKNWLEIDEDPDIIQMAMNPDVSVRFRGVMEKCTYCVQRIQRGKINAKNETGSRKPADGAVKTACQQACPSQAITFGDISDEQSVVTRSKRNDRNYAMLEELNTRPRTSYLAKLRNPNSELA